MAAAGVAVGDIGVRAFNPAGKIGPYEQIKDPINRIGRNPLSPCRRNRFCDIVGRDRAIIGRQRGEHTGTHLRPLFTRFAERMARSIGERGA